MTTADEQYDIRLEVEKALYALGDTASEVMETLVNKGINLDRCCRSLWQKGYTYDEMLENNVYEDRHGADNCPVHDYLAREFPELTYLTVGQQVTRAAQGRRLTDAGALSDETFVKNPPAVSMFISYYDNHGLNILDHG